jgi:hypothetical protein
MNILALDLGTTAGWAMWRSGRVYSGSHVFSPSRHEGGGMRFLRFTRFLEEFRGQSSDPLSGCYEPLSCCYEEVAAHRGTHAAHIYGGFHACLTSWAEAEAIPYLGVPVGTIKRYATGKGNASKNDMLAAIRARGYAPGCDNEADALSLLLWAMDPHAGNVAGLTAAEFLATILNPTRRHPHAKRPATTDL